MKTEIKKMHIENDVVNNQPKIIYTDADGVEWVYGHDSICYEGGGTMTLRKKSDCYYFKPKK